MTGKLLFRYWDTFVPKDFKIVPWRWLQSDPSFDIVAPINFGFSDFGVDESFQDLGGEGAVQRSAVVELPICLFHVIHFVIQIYECVYRVTEISIGCDHILYLRMKFESGQLSRHTKSYSKGSNDGSVMKSLIFPISSFAFLHSGRIVCTACVVRRAPKVAV